MKSSELPEQEWRPKMAIRERSGAIAEARLAARLGLLAVVALCVLFSFQPALAQPYPRVWQQVFPPVAPPAIAAEQAYDEARQVTVSYGGASAAEDALGDTWLWDGQAWTQQDVTGPGPRRAASMAYDSQRKVCVLFGGMDDNQDTWEWDGTKWSLRATNGPPPTLWGAMAYDRASGRTVLFGGVLCNLLCGPNPAHTWEWDGIQWTNVAQSGPQRRQAHSLAYDEVRKVTVLFGGWINNTTFLDDTWLWDGSAWTQAMAAGPNARNSASLAWDSHRGTLVLFGGEAIGVGSVSDTWEWDGAAWTQRLSGTPSPRSAGGLTYDRVRRQFVLHGGFNGRGLLQETWLLRFIETWVDYAYSGFQIGSFDLPFQTLAGGVNSAPIGSDIMIKPGTGFESITIGKPLTLRAPLGPVTIQGK